MDETDILDVADPRQRGLTLLVPSTRIGRTHGASAPELCYS